jgi:hypothetical protein
MNITTVYNEILKQEMFTKVIKNAKLEDLGATIYNDN